MRMNTHKRTIRQLLTKTWENFWRIRGQLKIKYIATVDKKLSKYYCPPASCRIPPSIIVYSISERTEYLTMTLVNSLNLAHSISHLTFLLNKMTVQVFTKGLVQHLYMCYFHLRCCWRLNRHSVDDLWICQRKHVRQVYHSLFFPAE
jgi:hypothetical protein